MSIEFSPQQEAALDGVSDWLECGDTQVYRLFGFAGTGKTTLAKYIAETFGKRVGFAAFTGKAAVVLKNKGCHGASTIHSLIYKPVQDQLTGEFEFYINWDSDINNLDLLVIDEVSMVNEEIGEDLLSFGKPILVLGDPGQLPPIKGAGFFTENCTPDHMLTEIHRQAEGDPIIDLATKARTKQALNMGRYGESVVAPNARVGREKKWEFIARSDIVLVGTNRLRHDLNLEFRKRKGIEDDMPVDGDRLVCLRNDHELGILNGELFDVVEMRTSPRESEVSMVVSSVDRPRKVEVAVRKEFFLGTDKDLDWREKRGMQEFTFGNVLTVHKSQGSQWDNVVLFDESKVFRQDASKWLYTGITRAAKSVTVFN